MGKTFSTGLLTDGISQDSSNNIGIGGAPSGTNKFEVSGSTKLNGNAAITGSLSITGSATTIGATTLSGSLTVSGSATTIGTTVLSGSLTVSGSITSTSTITAQTLVVQTITSSVLYSSGSNVFGNALSNTQVMTGSVGITGSLTLNNIAIPTSASLASTYLQLAGGTLTGTLTTNTPLAINLNYAGSVNDIQLGAATPLRIVNQAYNTVLFQVNNSGSVGVNGSPTGTYGTLSVFGGVSIKDDNNAKLEIGRYSSGASNSYIKLGANSNSLRFTNATDATDIMVLTNSGSLGLGVTSPRSILEVQKTTGNTSLGVASNASLLLTQGGNANDYSQIGFGYTQTTSPAVIGFLTTSGAGYTKGALIFATRDVTTDTAPTERMRIDASGNVGINLTSPTNRLDVTNEARSGTHASSQTMYVTGDFAAGDSGSAAKNNVEFRHVNGTQGIGFGYNSIYAAGSSANQNLCLTSKGTGNLILNGNANGGYTSGNVQVGGTTATDAKLYVKGASATSSNFAFLVNNSTPGDLFYCRNDGLINTGAQSASPYNNSTSGRSMVIESGGGLGYTSSTRESKINIETISNVNWINQLNPVSFNYRKKDDERNYTDEFHEEKSYGFIADEVETINPDFVFYNDKEDSTKELAGVKYESMTAILVKAIQEQQILIQSLQTQINELKNN
jgi:hypothetical protein